jgi:hypothetical protein
VNDKDLRQYAVLAIAEPYARMVDQDDPIQTREARSPIRSMLWFRHDIDIDAE